MTATSRTASLLLGLAAASAIAACSRKEEAAKDTYPSRVPLPETVSPLVIPIQPKGTAWSAAEGVVQFGIPGGAPLLRIGCERSGSDGARIRIERIVAAEPGAKAFFALVGQKRIARLPVDAQPVGGTSHWVGTFAAADPQIDVLADGVPIAATIPGGGTLDLPGSAELSRLVAECRRGAAPVASPGATAQSLPNLPSNPEASPAAR